MAKRFGAAAEIPQIATPSASPPAGSMWIYPKADGLWYTKNSAGTETAVGGGGGTASGTTFTPAGSIVATNVQTAIQELDTEKAPASHTHTKANITDFAHTHAIADLPTDATVPAALGTAAAGSATTVARRDHVHAMPTAANVGAAATVHSHAQSDVTSLVSDLAAKAPLASPAFTGTPTFSGETFQQAVTADLISAYKGTINEVATYAAGDLAVYKGVTYRANQAIAAGDSLLSEAHSLVGSWTAGTASAAALSVTIPMNTLRDGDELILSQPANSTPPGWTFLTSVTEPQGGTSPYLYRRTVTTGTAAFTFTMPVTTTNRTMILRAYRNVSYAGLATGASAITAATTTVSVAEGTATAQGSKPTLSSPHLIVSGVVHYYANNAGDTFTATSSSTPPGHGTPGNFTTTTALAQINKSGMFDRVSTTATTNGQITVTSSPSGGNNGIGMVNVFYNIVPRVYLDTTKWVEVELVPQVPQVDVFDATGAWVKPAGATRHRIIAVGGGGGGIAQGSSGGGGGGFLDFEVPTSVMGSASAITVGAGGVTGTAGGNTTVTAGNGVVFTAAGGGPGSTASDVLGGGSTIGPAVVGIGNNSRGTSWDDRRGGGGGGKTSTTDPGVGMGGGCGGGNLAQTGNVGRCQGAAGSSGATVTPAYVSGVGIDGVAGVITAGVCGSGGSGGTTVAGNGGKYGGGGGCTNSGVASAGTGGQGGVCIITYFD